MGEVAEKKLDILQCEDTELMYLCREGLRMELLTVWESCAERVNPRASSGHSRQAILGGFQ